jgi:hypothetical protein
MNSEGATSPFRSSAAPVVAPLRLFVRPWAITQVMRVALVGLLFAAAWLTDFMPNASVPYALVIVAMVAAAKLPVLTVRVRSEGGHVVTEGTRFPGPVTQWSCTLQEADAFVVTSETEGRHTFHAVALRTADGRTLPLTAAYACRPEGPRRAAQQLDAWLENARGRR